MKLSEMLSIEPGVTAIVGSGGKTTAMYLLAEELRKRGTVICCTTTHIRPPHHIPVLCRAGEAEAAGVLAREGILCLGTPAPEGKLAAPALPMARLACLADYVLAEADGSRGLPMKAHLSHEPVIPPEAGQTILLVGASGFGRPVESAAHRPERFCQLSGLAMGDPITPRALAAVLGRENLAGKVFVNQAEEDAAIKNARELAALVDKEVFAGALRGGIWACLS